MLRIAVCDDDREDLQNTAALVTDWCRSRSTAGGQVVSFQSGETMMEAVRARGGFDLYLLDILMPGCSGIQLGRLLRESGAGGEVIYLTSSNDFAADSYEVGAFFYLLKPVQREKLFRVLDAAAGKRCRRPDESIVIPTADGARRILLDAILYVERAGRGMRYCCSDGVVESRSIRIPFRAAAAPLLADARFWPCGASLVLNLRHVAGICGQTALMDNGASVPLPRTAAAAFKRAWGRYWLEESAW